MTDLFHINYIIYIRDFRYKDFDLLTLEFGVAFCPNNMIKNTLRFFFPNIFLKLISGYFELNVLPKYPDFKPKRPESKVRGELIWALLVYNFGHSTPMCMNTIYTIIQEFKGTKLNKTKKAFTVSKIYFTNFKHPFCPNTMQAFIYVYFYTFPVHLIRKICH